MRPEARTRPDWAACLLVLAAVAMTGMACSGSGGNPKDGPSCLQGLYDCLNAQGDCVLADAGAGQVNVSWDNGASVSGPVGLASFEANGPMGETCFSKSLDGNQIVLSSGEQTYRVQRLGTGAVEVTCPDGHVQEHAAGGFPADGVGIDPERLVGCRIAGICSTDSDCQPSQVCCQGACHDGERCPGTCDVDADCGQGNRCCGGLCTSLPACQTPCSGSFQCDDGVFCNGQETCVNNLCQPALPVQCNDGVACTQDACDEGARRCTNTPQDGQCGAEQRCDPNRGCEDIIACAGPGECDDSDACTQDDCVADICEFEQIQGCCRQDADCDDGVFCNGAERCVDHACTAGQQPECNDGVGCTQDSCDAGRDECAAVPDHDHCGPTEYCDTELGCVDGALCEDDYYEENDSMVDAASFSPRDPVPAMLCPGEVDWYTTQLNDVGVPILIVVMDPDLGALDVTWHNGAGPVSVTYDDSTIGVILMSYLGATNGEIVWIEIKGMTPDLAAHYLMILDYEVGG